MKLFDFESILASKIEIIVPSVQEGQLCQKWAWDVSSMVEFEAIDDESCGVEQNAAQQPLHQVDHRVIVEWVDAPCFRWSSHCEGCHDVEAFEER